MIVARRVDGLDKSGLRDMADSLKSRHERAVIVLASESDGKVSIVVSVTKPMTDRVHAGKIVKQIAPIVGGGGGGRPDFAEAGGRDPERIDDLLREGEADRTTHRRIGSVARLAKRADSSLMPFSGRDGDGPPILSSMTTTPLSGLVELLKSATCAATEPPSMRRSGPHRRIPTCSLPTSVSANTTAFTSFFGAGTRTPAWRQSSSVPTRPAMRRGRPLQALSAFMLKPLRLGEFLATVGSQHAPLKSPI
jgi:hypothetical protein